MSILSSMFQNGVSIDAYPEVQGMPDREKYSTINDIIVEENKAMTKDYTSMSCFERASILKLNLKKFVPVLKHNIYGYPYISGFKLKPDIYGYPYLLCFKTGTNFLRFSLRILALSKQDIDI